MLDDKAYAKFVHSVTSETSQNNIELLDRIEKLEFDQNMDVPALLTAALGLTGEAGEFADHVKKLIFHEKDDFESERREKMILELGDVMWYVMQGCKGLNISLEELINQNIYKLSTRHDSGGFKKYY